VGSEGKKGQRAGSERSGEQRGVPPAVSDAQDDSKEEEQTLQGKERNEKTNAERGSRCNHGQAIREFGPSLAHT
jgi:hypothetical protein